MLTLLGNFNKVLSNHFLSYRTLPQLQAKIITLKAIKIQVEFILFFPNDPNCCLAKKP